MTANPQKITFGEMRASGIRDVLIYCRDHHCSHHMEISAGRWGDQVRLSDGPASSAAPAASAARTCGRSFWKRGSVPIRSGEVHDNEALRYRRSLGEVGATALKTEH